MKGPNRKDTLALLTESIQRSESTRAAPGRGWFCFPPSTHYLKFTKHLQLLYCITDDFNSQNQTKRIKTQDDSCTPGNVPDSCSFREKINKKGHNRTHVTAHTSIAQAPFSRRGASRFFLHTQGNHITQETFQLPRNRKSHRKVVSLEFSR